MADTKIINRSEAPTTSSRGLAKTRGAAETRGSALSSQPCGVDEMR